MYAIRSYYAEAFERTRQGAGDLDGGEIAPALTQQNLGQARMCRIVRNNFV